jgi:hypothetical protein
LKTKSTTVTTILAFTSTALVACSRQGSIELTFCGYPDNNPPSAQTAYNCGGRNHSAGGTRTYGDPLSTASASGVCSQYEIVYVLYLETMFVVSDRNLRP